MIRTATMGTLQLSFGLVLLSGLAMCAEGSEQTGEVSPPTVVDEMDLSADLKKIDQQWDALLGYLDDEAVFNLWVGRVSMWKVGQQVGHVAAALELMAGWVDEVLANPEANAGEPTRGSAISALEGGIIPRGVAQAPPDTRMPFSIEIGEVRDSLNKAREHWNKIAARADDLASAPGRFEHFSYGYVSAPHLVRNNAIHTAHHLKIIRDIVAVAAQITEPGRERSRNVPSETQVVEAFVVAFNSMDVDAIMEFFTPDAVYHNMPSAPINGAEAIRRVIAGYVGLSEKIEWEILKIAQTGSTVLTERVDRFIIGGNPVELPVMGAFDISGGKIVAWRDYFDMAAWERQTSPQPSQ